MTAVPGPAEMTKAWLEGEFGSPCAPGWSEIVENDDEEQVFTRTGGPVCMCWGSAGEVVAHLGADRAVQTGYFCRQGTSALIAMHAEGHDLALVDGRYLVDGWLAHVTTRGPCVLDLHDAADLAKACLIHEPLASWSIVPDIMELGKAA